MSALYDAQVAVHLENILAEHISIYEQWLAVDQKKRKALIQRDREALELSVEEQSRLLVRLNDAETKRLQLLAQHGMRDGHSSVQELLERMPLPYREALQQQADQLSALLVRVEESNEQLAVLLQQAAAHNQIMLDALLGRDSTPATYAPQGPVQANTTQNAFRINQQA